MALNINSVGTVRHFKMEYIFKIQNPDEVENEYTVITEEAASDILANSGIGDFDKIKAMVAGLDMTAVSTRELSVLASELHFMGFRDQVALNFLGEGNMDSGLDGQPRNMDVKFNAIPLIHEQLKVHQEFATSAQRGREFGAILKSLENANRVLAALSYFAQSGKNFVSINEKV